MSVIFHKKYEPQASSYQGDSWRYEIEAWTPNAPSWLESAAEWIAEQVIRAEVAFERETLLEVTIEDLGNADIPIVGGLARKLRVSFQTHASPISPALINAISTALVSLGIVIIVFSVSPSTWKKVGEGLGDLLQNAPLILAATAVVLWMAKR